MVKVIHFREESNSFFKNMVLYRGVTLRLLMNIACQEIVEACASFFYYLSVSESSAVVGTLK
jgi:hypothetical protein